MAKQFDVSQEEIVNAIRGTATVWNDLQKEGLRGNFICPLCSLIKNIYKVSFQKGSARGACLLCPVKYFGKFHICVGIGHVFASSEISADEMKHLRKNVLNNLNELDTIILNNDEYNKYITFVINTRKTNNARIAKQNENVTPTKPRRIFKSGR